MIELYLQRNAIKVIENLGFLSNLEVLSLGSNYITKMEGLSQLKLLEILDLSDNLITEFNPKELPTGLCYLYLFDNSFFKNESEYEVRYKSINYLPKLINLDGLEVTFRERHICSGPKINKKYTDKGECSYISNHYNKEKEKRSLIEQRRNLLLNINEDQNTKSVNLTETSATSSIKENIQDDMSTKDKLQFLNYEIIQNKNEQDIVREDIQESDPIKENKILELDSFRNECDDRKKNIKQRIIDRSKDYIISSDKRMKDILSTLHKVRTQFQNFGDEADHTLEVMKDNIMKSAKVDLFLEKMENKMQNFSKEPLETINEQQSEHEKTHVSISKTTSSYSGLDALKEFSQSFSKNKDGKYELKDQQFNDLKEFQEALAKSRKDTTNESLLNMTLNKSHAIDSLHEIKESKVELESELGDKDCNYSRIDSEFRKPNQLLDKDDTLSRLDSEFGKPNQFLDKDDTSSRVDSEFGKPNQLLTESSRSIQSISDINDKSKIK